MICISSIAFLAFLTGYALEWSSPHRVHSNAIEPVERREQLESLGLAVSGSMEPSIPSPIQSALCNSCGLEFGFCLSSIDPTRPVRCRICEGPANWLDSKSAPVPVPLSSLRPRDHLKIGDRVTFRSDHQSPAEIKRIGGLPGQEVVLREGDLWLDSQRYTKGLPDLIEQSIFVRPIGLTPHQTLSIEPAVHDDYWLNHTERHSPLEVRDIGLVFRTEDIRPGEQLECEAIDDHETLRAVFRRPLNSDRFIIEWYRSSTESTQPFESDTEGNWFAFYYADGRWLCGTKSSWHTAESIELQPMHSSRIRWKVKWITQRTVEFEGWLVRDIYYRHGNLDSLRIPPGPGYVLLGDNQSISADSRNQNWDRIDRQAMEKKVDQASDELENLIRQRRLWSSRHR